MREVLAGIWDWEAVHPKIGFPVHCHYLAASGTVVDPVLPEEGLDPFRERHSVAHVLLTNRHHDRDAQRFVEAFGCDVLCNVRGLHEFEGRALDVKGFDFGDEPVAGVTAHEVLPEWPDETALLVEDARAVLIADSVIRDEGEALSFVPDRYLGDNAEEERAHLRAGMQRLLELDFEHLLFAHGPPLIGGAKDALREFVESLTA